MKTLLIIALALSLGACANFTEVLTGLGGERGLAILEDVADNAAKVEDATLGNAMKALPKYCRLPPSLRSTFRDRVNGRLEAEGNQIAIWCVGDPSLTLGAPEA